MRFREFALGFKRSFSRAITDFETQPWKVMSPWAALSRLSMEPSCVARVTKFPGGISVRQGPGILFRAATNAQWRRTRFLQSKLQPDLGVLHYQWPHHPAR